jgi:hypothetical protein
MSIPPRSSFWRQCGNAAVRQVARWPGDGAVIGPCPAALRASCVRPDYTLSMHDESSEPWKHWVARTADALTRTPAAGFITSLAPACRLADLGLRVGWPRATGATGDGPVSVSLGCKPRPHETSALRLPHAAGYDRMSVSVVPVSCERCCDGAQDRVGLDMTG